MEERSARAEGRAMPLLVHGALLAAAMALLVCAMSAGLARMGLDFPGTAPALTTMHGPLMVCGFLATLISLERAVALHLAWAYLAPVCSAIGAIALVVGIAGPAGPILITLGAVALVAIFAEIIRRQPELFNFVMAMGAVALVVGDVAWAADVPIPEMVFWWGGFLVLTICGERLELSRMTGASPRARGLFAAAAGLLTAGMLLASLVIIAGFRVFGAGLIALGLWIVRYDMARRTIRFDGLPRFIAVNLLAGAAWLCASGIFWILFASNVTTFEYDAMLHSLFLGFVFSMIFAHAPVIFPAIIGRPMPFRRIFYVHVGLLHASLALRIFGGDLFEGFEAYQWGGILNVVAILAFIAATVFAVASGAVSAADTPVAQRASAGR
jgi:hypothetical protein